MPKINTDGEVSIKTMGRLQEIEGHVGPVWSKPALTLLATVALISLALGIHVGWFDIKAAELSDGARQNNTCLISHEIRQLVELHNQTRQSGARCGKRKKRKVGKLLISCQLTSAAQQHSEYMHQQKVLNHRGRNGSSSGNRANEVGYQWKAIAENIANGFTLAPTVHQAWLKSKDHCRNIMNQSYTEIGAARVGNYWTVMFGTKLKTSFPNKDTHSKRM